MMPHLVRWHERYASQGLSIIYVDDGRRDPLESASRWPLEERIPYHVFHDTTGAATSTYAIRAYPTAYVLDRSGRVVWEGIPLYGPGEAEQAIAAALR
jgi:hypothetical protein